MIFEETQKQLEQDVSEFLINKNAQEKSPKSLEDLGIL
jgi:hypothetical protein